LEPRESHETRLAAEAVLGLPAGTLQGAIEPDLAEFLRGVRRNPTPKVPVASNALARMLDGLRVPTLRKWPWPDANPVCASLSHDVDEVRWSWRRRALMAVRHPGTLFEPNRRYWNFARVKDLEAGHSVRSSWFFVAEGRHPQDPPYRVAEVQDAIRDLAASGHEVGLHGSFLSYRDPALLERERRAISAAVGRPVPGVRQHFLNFEAPLTWRIQEAAGFSYDASLGFNETSGFRNGLCHPFRPPGQRILEIPLIIMDGQLFWYEHLAVEEAKENCERIAMDVLRLNGLLTLNWHQHTYDEYSFPGWWDVYEHLLRWLKAHRALFMTCEGIADWWRRREQTTITPAAGTRPGTWVVQSAEPLRGLTLCGAGGAEAGLTTDAPHRVVSFEGRSLLVLDELRPGSPAEVRMTR